MNQHHQKILAEINKFEQSPKKYGDRNYLGTTSEQYKLTNPQKWQIAKNWARENKDISFKDFVYLLDSLSKGSSHEEKTIAGMILFLFPKLRSRITPKEVNRWLENRHGWSEVDNLCQNNLKYQDFYLEWPTWEKALRNFSKDKNVHVRRASLVLLTGPVNYCPDKKLSDLAFENIESLKSEKDILITKAVSWLLRSLVKHHKSEVANYLDANKAFLPKIAVREVSYKLLYGVKKKLNNRLNSSRK